MTYKLNDDTVIEVNLYSDKAVVAPEDYRAKIKSIFKENQDLAIIVFILLTLELILVIYKLIILIIKVMRRTKT